MKLYISTGSPFVRKVRIAVRERGLLDQVEEIVVDPYANAPALLASNPIVQVPTLIAQDGLPISDSPVICEYLDSVGPARRLLPTGETRWAVRRVETLAASVLEMGVKLLLEMRRPDGEQSPHWKDRWHGNLNRALDVLEGACPEADTLDIGAITAGVAVTWIGFRHPDLAWQDGRPRLAALQAALEARPSFVDTRPK